MKRERIERGELANAILQCMIVDSCMHCKYRQSGKCQGLMDFREQLKGMFKAKNPIVRRREVNLPSVCEIEKDAYCPSCYQYLIPGCHYCHVCGQAIDWGRK